MQYSSGKVHYPRRKKLNMKKVGIAAVAAIILLAILIFLFKWITKPSVDYYLAGITPTVSLNTIVDDEVTDEVVEVVRGTELNVKKKPNKNRDYYIVSQKVDGKYTYLKVDAENIVTDKYQVVSNKEVYARLLVNLRKDRDSDISDTIVERYEAIPVVSVDYEYDFNEETGEVAGYTVSKNGENYYVLARYVEPTLELAQIDYSGAIEYSTYWDSYFGKGFSKETYIDSIDYKPVEKMNYTNNPLKGDINGVHVGMSIISSQSDYLIQLCKESGINALVLEVKSDGGSLAYESEAAKNYLKDPSKAFGAAMSKSDFEALIKKYKDAGIYLIARIVSFKDPVYAMQWPEESIVNSDGSLFRHDGIYWPTAYSRNAWRYNVAIAKEVAAMGFNEIQFDYVRFPDGIRSYETSGTINLNNTYGENKVQALQHFLMYAHDELSKMNVYLAADVFGWPAVAYDDQNIGQFIPAISNVVDVISPMPYADHFGAYNFGIAQPWQEPGLLLEKYSLLYADVNNTIPTPALYRTWIQGYACLSYVCTGSEGNPKRSYGPSDMVAQIKGIQAAGYEGYMVWSGEGGQYMFDFRKEGFIESTLEEDQKYVHEYKQKEDSTQD